MTTIQTLKQIVCDQGPVPCRTAVEYIRQAAVQLHQKYHLHGETHSALSPRALVLVDGNLQVLEHAALNMSTRRTRYQFGNSPVVDSLDYLAPEQALEGSAGPASDIYGLGCVFYYILAGRPVFVGDTLAQTLMQHQADPPDRLPDLRSELPASLWKIIQRMLAKRPIDRYRSADDLAVELAGWLANHHEA